MKHERHNLSAEHHYTTEYQSKILELARDFPDAVISEKGLKVATSLFAEMKQQYGEKGTENYKPYHNDEHAWHVLERSWVLWDTFKTVLPEKFAAADFELLLIASAGHDIVWSLETPEGEDEQKSADYTATLMEQNGYDETSIFRVKEAILATTVERDEQGVISQSKLRAGDKDPLKLTLASADINGVAMEGMGTMLNDTFNLFQEFSHSNAMGTLFNPNNLMGLLKYQSQFLRDRYEAIDGDIDYFFTEIEALKLKAVYGDKFSASGKEAHHAAKRLLNQTLAERALRMTLGGAIRFAGARVENLERVKHELKRVLSK